jgi:hypothetical protein
MAREGADAVATSWELVQSRLTRRSLSQRLLLGLSVPHRQAVSSRRRAIMRPFALALCSAFTRAMIAWAAPVRPAAESVHAVDLRL